MEHRREARSASMPAEELESPCSQGSFIDAQRSVVEDPRRPLYAPANYSSYQPRGAEPQLRNPQGARIQAQRPVVEDPRLPLYAPASSLAYQPRGPKSQPPDSEWARIQAQRPVVEDPRRPLYAPANAPAFRPYNPPDASASGHWLTPTDRMRIRSRGPLSNVIHHVGARSATEGVTNWVNNIRNLSSFEDMKTNVASQEETNGADSTRASHHTDSPTPSDSFTATLWIANGRRGTTRTHVLPVWNDGYPSQSLWSHFNRDWYGTDRRDPKKFDEGNRATKGSDENGEEAVDSEPGGLIGLALYALLNGRIAPTTSAWVPSIICDDPANVVDMPATTSHFPVGAMAELNSGFEDSETRVRTFVDNLDNASIGVRAHEKPPSIPESSANLSVGTFDRPVEPVEEPCAWRPETGPTEPFSPPHVESPVPEPTKASNTAQESSSRPTLRRVGRFERH
ncbi:MAG: hypothetical protein Q9218_000331 [Villophora microphyllina]